MKRMNSWLAMLIGFVAVLVVIAAIGWWSGRKVKTEEDFAAGSGKAGTLIVTGTIMGTLVSGQATLGTAQLAFSFGISAWWFTLGSGIGCLVLALLYVTRMRATHKTTLVGVIVEEYGTTIDYAASIFSTIGIFISMVAQMIAATALITALTPLPLLAATLLSACLMACYVIFGGVWGTGIAGIAKLILLYAACIVGGSVALWLGNGPSGIMGSISTLFCSTEVGSLHALTQPEAIDATFLSLVARGPLHDLGSALALVLGVISTQSYASAVWSAKSNVCAKRGALLSAFLIPPIGAACIVIGLYMRGTCLTANEAAALISLGNTLPDGMLILENTAQVFPQFIIHCLPPLFSGVALGTLFVTIVGGGAGLALGAATVVVQDLLGRLTTKIQWAKVKLALIRIVIALLLFAAVLCSLALPNTMINDLGFLSMGLRGAVIFIPFTFALYAAGKVSGFWANIAVFAGPLAVLGGNAGGLPFDPLFVGIAASVAIMLIGVIARIIKRAHETSVHPS